MFKVFACDILHEVASKCEDKISQNKKDAKKLDNVSKMLTEALIDLSRVDGFKQ